MVGTLTITTYLKKQCECHPLIIFRMFYSQRTSASLRIIDSRKRHFESLLFHKCIYHCICRMNPAIGIENVFGDISVKVCNKMVWIFIGFGSLISVKILNAVNWQCNESFNWQHFIWKCNEVFGQQFFKFLINLF